MATDARPLPQDFTLVAWGTTFPLVFTITQSFTRRERALSIMASLKASVIALYFMHRDWDQSISYPASAPNHQVRWISVSLPFRMVVMRLPWVAALKALLRACTTATACCSFVSTSSTPYRKVYRGYKLCAWCALAEQVRC